MIPLSAALVLIFGAAVAQDQDAGATADTAPAPAEIAPGYATDEDLRQVAQDLFHVLLPTAPPAYAVDATRRELGPMLFFDPRMSTSGLFSCQTCHNVEMEASTRCRHPSSMAGRRGRATRPPSTTRS
jgi:cytochrome c peroxidase